MVAKDDADAARYVHWGATSQDVIDTAVVLELRVGIDVLVSDLDRAIAAFATLADRHRHTPTVARTWLQHALPMPFGLKLAGYTSALARRANGSSPAHGRARTAVRRRGGNARSSRRTRLGGVERLAARLDLPLPEAPWHSHRDRLAEVAAALAILSGSCGKIARDVTLLMQTDVAEVFEPAAPGRGGSSTMPQKRNPTAAAAVLAAAAIAPQLAATILGCEIQEHERATGPWLAEWPTFPALLLVVSGALAGIVDIAEGLEVDSARMRANLDSTHGLVMAEALSFALAARIGKHDAHKLVEEASRMAITEKRHLQEVLGGDIRVTKHLGPDEIKRLFDPLSYQGVSQAFIDRMLAKAETR